jgi:heme oxygenase
MTSTHVSFADVLRLRTAELHRVAEGSGVVRDMILARVTPGAYVLFLRNLLPAYRALEAGLQDHWARSGAEGVGALHHPSLLRAATLERDLATLAGADWAQAVVLLPEAVRYAERVAAAAGGEGMGLLAHAYTRYLGDLAGGRVLRRRVCESLGLDDSALAFYAFPGIDDVSAFARAYRGTIDALGARLATPRAVIEEASVAFQLNIELSEAVARADAVTPAAKR